MSGDIVPLVGLADGRSSIHAVPTIQNRLNHESSVEEGVPCSRAPDGHRTPDNVPREHVDAAQTTTRT